MYMYMCGSIRDANAAVYLKLFALFMDKFLK